MSLFEVYDPYIYLFNLNLNWFVLGFLVLLLSCEFWACGRGVSQGKIPVVIFILGEFSVFFKYSYVKKGSVLLLVGLFFFILLCNFLGLIPYVFSSSSHLVYTITLSFPAWGGLMLLGWCQFSKRIFSHLIPSGTPLPLVPLMVGVESVRILIRPVSLAVRLMSNIISGHLLIRLLGSCGMSFILIQSGFFLFEVFVCFIQAYVFSGLISLYRGEV